ncbi:MAG: dihydrolipoyl dehydrogenase family protein, partial [Bacteroidota bacterium]
MASFDYQVAVIGSGPGGYVAAIRCAQLGFRTAIIEKYPTLGGTCLNVGCIPSKALLDSSEHFHAAAHSFAEHGIEINAPKANLVQMIKRKAGVVKANVEGIAFLMKKNKIDVLQGLGSFVDRNTISVAAADGTAKTITAEKVIIATGSKPVPLPFAPFDKRRIISSTEALEMKEIPGHLIIVGGGVIGMELGSVYARLGSKVSVVEFMDNIIPTMDTTMGKELMKSTKKLGMEFFLGHKVTAVTNTGKEVNLTAEDKSGKKIELKGDYCLVCIGRRAYTEGLALNKIGIETVNGQIPVDDHLRTSVDNVY